MTMIKILQCLLIVSCIALVLPNDTNGHIHQCSNSDYHQSILIVGVVSAFVFCFIGILPSFFIRTDADEKKFGNFNKFI